MKMMILYTKKQPAAVQGRTRTVGIRLINVMKKYEKQARADYTGITKFFNHDVPVNSKMHYRNGDISLIMGADSQVWDWVSRGTSVRYATMKKGYLRKTNPGTLRAWGGFYTGDTPVSFVSRKFPHKGIEGRLYEEQIMEKYSKQFEADVGRAVRLGIMEFVKRGYR